MKNKSLKIDKVTNCADNGRFDHSTQVELITHIPQTVNRSYRRVGPSLTKICSSYMHIIAVDWSAPPPHHLSFISSLFKEISRNFPQYIIGHADCLKVCLSFSLSSPFLLTLLLLSPSFTGTDGMHLPQVNADTFLPEYVPLPRWLTKSGGISGFPNHFLPMMHVTSCPSCPPIKSNSLTH